MYKIRQVHKLGPFSNISIFIKITKNHNLQEEIQSFLTPSTCFFQILAFLLKSQKIITSRKKFSPFSHQVLVLYVGVSTFV